MKHIASIIFLLFIFGYTQSQETIVFKLGSGITEKDRIVFKEKMKYLVNDFYQEDKIVVEEDKVNNTFCITIDKPTVILLTLLPDVKSYQEIYLDRGDTVVVDKRFSEELNQSYLYLTGRDDFSTSQYNFHWTYEMWQKENPIPFYQKGTDLNLHKKTVKEWIEKKKVFNNDYLKKEKALLEFADFLNHRLECEYTFLLLFPIFNHVTDYPDNYMDGKISGDYNSRLFVVGANLYVMWYKEVEKYDFVRMIEFVNSNFNGDTREYFVSLIFGVYSDGEKIDGGMYLQLADKYENALNNEGYVNYIKRAKDYFSRSLSILPDSIKRNTKLKSIDLEEFDFETILENYKGKYIILDFWASWCGPCVRDIKASGKMKSFLTRNNVVYIYLSLDTNSDSWKTLSSKLGINDNQYMLQNVKDSPLINYFKIVGIPRYIYLNKDLSVINLNGKAPLIENKEYFKEIFNIK